LKDESSPPRQGIFKKETAMKRNRGFDEVMIVNPYEPGSNANQGVRFMRFYAAPPEMGYYAEAPDHYGYYAEAPDHYGYYAAPANDYGYYANLPEQYGAIEPGYSYAEPVGYVAEPYPMGYYGDPYAMGGYGEHEPMGNYGYYAEAPHMEGYYAEAPHMEGYYAEAPHMEGYYGYAPMGYYAESPDVSGYAQYAEAGEMPGYAHYEPLAEDYSAAPGYGAYGAGYGEDYSGYVRETEPRYNAGCPMPTNVHGFSDVDMVDGYVRPSTVNPTCGQITPAPRRGAEVPDGFKPLW
jgi:hypothetical protein